jgi:hypothetical protein
MIRNALPVIAKVFLLAYALDAGLSVLDEILRGVTQSTLLIPARNAVANVVILASLPVYLLLGLTPRFPVHVYLPLVLSVGWLNFMAAPLPVLFESPEAVARCGAMIQAGLAIAAVLRIRALSGGTSWLFAPLPKPGFSIRHTAAFAALTVFGIVPLALLYSVLALTTWLEVTTNSFVSFDLRGVSLADRRYARDDQEIRLVGMMHIGQGDAYRALFESFSTPSTVVLEEGVTDEQGLLASGLSYSNVADALGLQMQANAASYLDGGDSSQMRAWPHFRHADVDTAFFSPSTLEFIEHAGRVWGAPDFASGLDEFLRVSGEKGEVQILLDEVVKGRNAHLLGEIEDALVDYRRIIVPWGALHLPEIEAAIVAIGFERTHDDSLRLISWRSD